MENRPGRMAQRQADDASGAGPAPRSFWDHARHQRVTETEHLQRLLPLDFAEAFAIYLPNQTVTPSQPNNDGLCDALQSVTPDTDVTVSKV